MQEKSDEYVLDFVIPCGPTGPKSDSDICFISYGYKKNVSGDLQIEKSRIIPDNSSIYTINGDEVQVETGVYEITYCGNLKKPEQTGQALLNLYVMVNGSSTTLPDMGIYLAGDDTYTYFSSTGVFDFTQKRNLVVNLAFFGTTNVEVDKVNVLIKKIG